MSQLAVTLGRAERLTLAQLVEILRDQDRRDFACGVFEAGATRVAWVTNRASLIMTSREESPEPESRGIADARLVEQFARNQWSRAPKGRRVERATGQLFTADAATLRGECKRSLRARLFNYQADESFLSNVIGGVHFDCAQICRAIACFPDGDISIRVNPGAHQMWLSSDGGEYRSTLMGLRRAGRAERPLSITEVS